MPRLSSRWLLCLGGLFLAFILSVVPVEGTLNALLLRAAALVLAGAAVGLKKPLPLGILALAGALVGLLPYGISAWLAGGFLGLVTAFFLLIWINSPFSPVPAEPGTRYRVNGIQHTVPDLEVLGQTPYLLNERLIGELDRLAAYADELLARHGIRYVAMYGTVLGAVRHGGLIPWDDDIDFRLHDRQNRDRLRERFPLMAAEARRDGFVLFPHGTYWKLGVDNFWRYPAVDLFDPPGDQEPKMEIRRMPFERGALNMPGDAVGWVRGRYGEGALTQIVQDLPFWDSGFVPALMIRLVGPRIKGLAADFYARLFFVTSK